MPDDATFGEKQYVSLNRAYLVIQPTANLKKTTVEQMRAAVRKAKVKPAVLPVARPGASLPDLSQEQMNLFAEWLKSGTNGEQLTMILPANHLSQTLCMQRKDFQCCNHAHFA